MRQFSVLVGAAAMAWSGQVQAQDDVAPTPLARPAIFVPGPAPASDSNVAPFYAAHPATLIWLRDADSRAAAAKLAEFLKHSPIDGLADGPALAASVEAALAGSTASDDQVISTAWVRYVQALRRPVSSVSFGDPALQLKPPSASQVLRDCVAAPSLTTYVESASSVNPLYSALRQEAIAARQEDDAHVRATLDRLRLIPAKGRAILVDAANAQLMMLEDGRAIGTMKVIVGKPDFATPLLAGSIWYITFNPYWHIPQDVAKRKVAPIVLKRGVEYLRLARYQAVAAFGGDKEEPIDPTTIDWKAVAAGTAEAHIRQLSGPQNMMGKMKFGFVNDYGIFLHDTPEKALFAKAKRNLSLGCVRLEHPEALAAWLLGHDPAPPSDNSEENVRIGGKGVPIYISYLTARPDNGKIAFADDVYKLDGSKADSRTAATSATSIER